VRYWLVMPAAGSGSRFGSGVRKPYAPLEGRTVIEWALAPFLADRRCAQLVVALARDDADWKKVAARLAASGASAVTTVEGGERRSDSVRRALASLAASASPSDWVLVHDAARPCLDPADLGRLLDRLGTHPVGGLLATRVSDTLKRTGHSGAGAAPPVTETVERSDLWRALTPQMFRFGPLCAALLVEGDSMNLKITLGADLALAAAVLRARRA
jgi:2-C-methyl-D-erythritol 4-phosphate cytidylyltransferase